MAPFVTYLAVVLVVILVLRQLLHVAGFEKIFGHTAIAELESRHFAGNRVQFVPTAKGRARRALRAWSIELNPKSGAGV